MPIKIYPKEIITGKLTYEDAYVRNLYNKFRNYPNIRTTQTMLKGMAKC